MTPRFHSQAVAVEDTDTISSSLSLLIHLSAIYKLTQESNHLFASPLGPFHLGRRHAYLPRLVFFGPHASDESWRLAFLAGFDARDGRSSHSLLTLAERLAADSEGGEGVLLAFFTIGGAAA